MKTKMICYDSHLTHLIYGYYQRSLLQVPISITLETATYKWGKHTTKAEFLTFLKWAHRQKYVWTEEKVMLKSEESLFSNSGKIL
jgi:hypothetical protein